MTIFFPSCDSSIVALPDTAGTIRAPATSRFQSTAPVQMRNFHSQIDGYQSGVFPLVEFR